MRFRGDVSVEIFPHFSVETSVFTDFFPFFSRFSTPSAHWESVVSIGFYTFYTWPRYALSHSLCTPALYLSHIYIFQISVLIFQLIAEIFASPQRDDQEIGFFRSFATFSAIRIFFSVGTTISSYQLTIVTITLQYPNHFHTYESIFRVTVSLTNTKCLKFSLSVSR